MHSRTAARRASRATWIAVFLIVLGIFAWGMRYKLSLYDPPGSPSRSIAQAKLLSPNERPDSLRSVAQLGPQDIGSSPAFFLTVFISALCLGALPVRLIRAQAVASREALHGWTHYGCESIASFFFFRPPPAFTLAQ